MRSVARMDRIDKSKAILIGSASISHLAKDTGRICQVEHDRRHLLHPCEPLSVMGRVRGRVWYDRARLPKETSHEGAGGMNIRLDDLSQLDLTGLLLYTDTRL